MTAGRAIIAALAALLILTAVAFSADPPTLKVRVNLDKPNSRAALRAMGFEGVYVSDNHADLYTDAGGLERIQRTGLSVEVLIEDVAAYYAELLAEYDGMGGYKTFSEVVAYLDGMIADHPNILSDKISIGQSIEGRDIWAVKISDNPGIDEDEPEILFHSLTHSNEPSTMEILIYFMDHLTDNYGTEPEVTWTIDNREIWFVLVVNPDGYVYNEVTYPDGGGTWRKNRRDNLDGSYGVDINRNYGYMWGYDDEGSSPLPSSPAYRGTGPFSEPEAQAMRDFALAHDFEVVADYHSPGVAFIWPNCYDLSLTPDENIYVLLADSMAVMSGYNPLGPIPHNGCAYDWQYGEQTLKDKSLGICVEVGGSGLWPDPSELPDLLEENLAPGMFLCRVADSVFLADSARYLGAPDRPVVHVPGSEQGPDYTVTWSHEDTLNPAVLYKLAESTGLLRLTDPANTLDNWSTHTFVITEDDYISAPSAIYTRFLKWDREMTSVAPIYVTEWDSLKFWTSYDFASGWDYFYVEVSTDCETFESIPGNITTNDDPHGYNLGNGITGDSDGWVEGLFDLSDWVGQSIWLRFSAFAYKEVAALYLDDIYPITGFETQTIVAADLTDTLYDFTGMSDGEYFYQVQAQDAQAQWSGGSNFGFVTVSQPTYVCGDANGDGEVTQLDVAYLIDYLRKDGPAPDPMEAGDANGDGTVDQLDCKYLVEYLHKGGPEPICP